MLRSSVNEDVELITSMCRWAARRKLYRGHHHGTPITGRSQILVRNPHRERQRAISDIEFDALYRQTR